MKIRFTKAQLNKLRKDQLFRVFTLFVNDEMFPIMWRGFPKPQCVKMILDGNAGANPMRRLPETPNEVEFEVEPWMKNSGSYYPDWLTSYEVKPRQYAKGIDR